MNRFDPESYAVHTTTGPEASHFAVIDFGAEVLLTDIIVPLAVQYSQLTVDTWLVSEGADADRLVLGHPIGTPPPNQYVCCLTLLVRGLGTHR